jgi:hypothetical protein
MWGQGMTGAQDLHDRRTRAARNQSLFREINERITDLNEAFSAITATGEWICECANDTCIERVEMSSDEYESVRAQSTRFLVAPGDEHVWADVEQVAERNDNYWIVEKLGEPGELARRADPRSDDAPPHQA